MTKELAVPAAGGALAMPDFMKGKEVANLAVDASDLILPRLKLLQGISKEVEAFDHAKAGNFWHNVLNESLGSEVEFIVAAFRKKYLLMAPMNDPRGVLARAEDGIHWLPPQGAFEVKLKGVKDPQVWKLAPTVRESGLAEFGSSVAGDNDSKPAAVLIYEFLIYLTEHPHLSPIIMSLSRSQAKRGKDLISKIQFRQAPLAGMKFKAIVTDEVGDEGPYKNVAFQSTGFANEQEFNTVEDMAKKFATYKVHDEEDVVTEGEKESSAPVASEI